MMLEGRDSGNMIVEMANDNDNDSIEMTTVASEIQTG